MRSYRLLRRIEGHGNTATSGCSARTRRTAVSPSLVNVGGMRMSTTATSGRHRGISATSDSPSRPGGDVDARLGEDPAQALAHHRGVVGLTPDGAQSTNRPRRRVPKRAEALQPEGGKVPYGAQAGLLRRRPSRPAVPRADRDGCADNDDVAGARVHAGVPLGPAATPTTSAYAFRSGTGLTPAGEYSAAMLLGTALTDQRGRRSRGPGSSSEDAGTLAAWRSDSAKRRMGEPLPQHSPTENARHAHLFLPLTASRPSHTSSSHDPG